MCHGKQFKVGITLFFFFNFSTNMYSTKLLCKMLIQSNDKNKIKLPQLTVERDTINISY